MNLDDKRLRQELHSTVKKEKRYAEYETKTRSTTTVERYDYFGNLVHNAELGGSITPDELNLIASTAKHYK